MDPEAFLDMANQVIKLKMFPYFDIAHSVLCALHVREDLGPGKPNPTTGLILNLKLAELLSLSLVLPHLSCRLRFSILLPTILRLLENSYLFT